jgi:hypothetical protein
VKVDYNTNNAAGATCKQLGIGSVQEALERGLALSEGEWDGGWAAFECDEDEQGLDLNGDHVVLVEREGE